LLSQARKAQHETKKTETSETPQTKEKNSKKTGIPETPSTETDTLSLDSYNDTNSELSLSDTEGSQPSSQSKTGSTSSLTLTSASRDDFASQKLTIAVGVGHKTTEELKKKTLAVKKDPKASQNERGVIYLGQIPFGFFEDEMRSYFEQFGTVTRLTLARSKKTGRSKGFSFIEFENKEVAEIVAATMHNYLMYQKRIICKIVPVEKVHDGLFYFSRNRINRGVITKKKEES